MAVERIAVVPQLDEHAIAAERVDELAQRALGGGRAVASQRGRHRALAASGEHEPVVVVAGSAVPVHRARAASASCASDVRGAPFSPASCASLIALREPRVPDRSLREHDQVLAGRVGDPVRRTTVRMPSVSSAPNTVGSRAGGRLRRSARRRRSRRDR